MSDDYRRVVGEPVLVDDLPICPGCGSKFESVDGVTRATIIVKKIRRNRRDNSIRKDACDILMSSMEEISRYHCRYCHKLLARDDDELDRVFQGYQDL